jgi:hypothetical protein
VRFVPEPVPGARSTADYPQPVPDPLPVSDPLPVPDPVDVVRSAGRGEVWSHRLRAAGRTSGRKTWVRFREKGQCQRDPRRDPFFSGIAHRLREVRPLEEYGKGYTKKYVVHVRILCYE